MKEKFVKRTCGNVTRYLCCIYLASRKIGEIKSLRLIFKIYIPQFSCAMEENIFA